MAREYAIGTDDVENNNETRKCLNCGYGLSGLAEKGLCPECGVAFGDEIVLTGFKNKGGPSSNIITGIVIFLLGSMQLWLTLINAPYLLTWDILMATLINPCSVVGAILLIVGLRGMSTAGRHGGDLRWVLNEKGIYTIWGSNSERKLVPWDEIKRVASPIVLGIRPRRWRVLKIRRSWGSWDFFRRRTPMLWIKAKTRSEIRDLSRMINDQYKM